MKKTIYSLLTIGLLCWTTLAWAQSGQPTAGIELRPAQKAMQARSGWLKAMNVNLAAMKFEEVGNDAAALASQTEMAAGKLANPQAKELTLQVSSLAASAAIAAGKKDGETVKMKLAEIKATCGECHAKIRDKK